jgi:hypothetical protein
MGDQRYSGMVSEYAFQKGVTTGRRGANNAPLPGAGIQCVHHRKDGERLLTGLLRRSAAMVR